MVQDPRSFEELRKMDDFICASYREACSRKGVLNSNKYWRETLEEAAVRHSPSKLLVLFAIMQHWNNPSDPLALWEEFKHQLLEDKLHHYRQRVGNVQLDANDKTYNQALINLEDKVLSVGGKLLKV